MKVRVTLEFNVTDEAVEEAAEHGVSREEVPQSGADNIAALLNQFGLGAESAVGVEVTE